MARSRKVKNPRLLRACMVLGMVVTFVCGVIVSRGFVEEVYWSIEIADWQETPVDLFSVNIEQKEFRDHNRRTYYDRYLVTVKYGYEFSGRNYTSDRLGIVEKWGDESMLALGRSLKEIASSDQKTVAYVNPDKPDEALLINEISLKSIIATGFFSLVLWVLCYLAYFAFKRAK